MTSAPIRVLYVSDDLEHAQALAAEVSRRGEDIVFLFPVREGDGQDKDLEDHGTADVLLLDCHLLHRVTTIEDVLGRFNSASCPRIALVSPEDLPQMAKMMLRDIDLYLNKTHDISELADLLVHKIKALKDLARAEDIRLRTEKRLQALVELAQTRSVTFDEVADYSLRKIVEMTGSEMGYMAFLEDQDRTLRMYAWCETGLSRCRLANKPILYSMEKVGVWGEPIRQGKPIVLNDFHEPNPLKRGTPDGHVEIHRYLAVPIFLDGKVVGTEGVANKKHPYDDIDVNQMQLLAEGMVSIQHGIEMRHDYMESQAKYQALLDSVPFTVALLDEDSRILSINRSPPGTELTPQELIGRILYDMDNGAGEEYAQLFRSAVETAQPLREERVIKDAEGNAIHLSLRISPVRTSDSESLTFIATIEDITETRKALLNLHKNREKQKLMESVTYHDIFNQVQIMKGYLELMGSDESRKEQDRRMFSRVEKAADNISDQVKVLRDYYALGLSDPEWLSLEQQIKRALEGSGLTVDSLCIDCESRKVQADRSFYKVFHNLFQNSMKHGNGITRVAISCQDLPDKWLRIVYTDDGIGIPKDDKERIFERGFGKHTGLGMFLVREILHTSGFKIRETGVQGARFEIDIPPGFHRLA